MIGKMLPSSSTSEASDFKDLSILDCCCKSGLASSSSRVTFSLVALVESANIVDKQSSTNPLSSSDGFTSSRDGVSVLQPHTAAGRVAVWLTCLQSFCNV